MKQNGRKIIALILAVIMAFGALPAVVAVAAQEDVSYKVTNPYIYIHGLLGSTVYDDPTSPNGKDVMDVGGILTGILTELAPDILLCLALDDWETLGGKLIPALVEGFEPAFIDKSGDVTDGSGVRFYYPSKNSIRADSELNFVYDWRTDPIACAKQLNDFIEYVCDASGCEQVSISAHSCGGLIILAYLSIYGNERISGVVMNSTAIYGQTYTGELLTNKLEITGSAVKAYIDYALRDEIEYDDLLSEVLGALDNAGLLSIIDIIGDGLIENLGERVIKEFLLPLFVRWPSIWAMCPDEYMDEALEMVFNDLCKDEKDEYAGLINKIQNYNEEVRVKREDALNQIAESGRIGVFARYGYSSVPVTISWRSMSDGVIDAKYASFGAITSDYDKKLTKSQLAGVDEKYISPDEQINASTCLFPEQTWFIKYFKHSASIGQLQPLEYAILYAPEKVTVDTYARYPRYLIMDTKTGDITAQLVPEKEPSAPVKYTNILVQFINLIRYLIKLISEKLGK